MTTYIDTPWGIFPDATVAMDALIGPAFSVGDVVHLASGGQPMTVEEVGQGGTVFTAWFEGNDRLGWTLQRDEFDAGLLVPATDAGGCDCTH